MWSLGGGDEKRESSDMIEIHANIKYTYIYNNMSPKFCSCTKYLVKNKAVDLEASLCLTVG